MGVLFIGPCWGCKLTFSRVAETDPLVCGKCYERALRPGERCPVCRQAHGGEYLALVALGFPPATALKMVETAALKAPCVVSPEMFRQARPQEVVDHLGEACRTRGEIIAAHVASIKAHVGDEDAFDPWAVAIGDIDERIDAIAMAFGYDLATDKASRIHALGAGQPRRPFFR